MFSSLRVFGVASRATENGRYAAPIRLDAMRPCAMPATNASTRATHCAAENTGPGALEFRRAGGVRRCGSTMR